MTLEEMKNKIYSMIEEYDDEADDLTNDEDIATKINGIINQIQNELARIKKIPARKEMAVAKDEEITLKDIDKNIYQLSNIKNVDYDIINDSIIFNEDGTAKIYYFKYPQQINSETEDSFTLELSTDVLEIMPYGVAGDLLKNDPSNQYGAIYTARYQQLLNELDIRYAVGTVALDEGIGV